MLSAMLLYSLMLSDVDAKTYEYGMLRSLGFKKSYLMRMILMQSTFFSVPGIICGVLVAFITNILLREVIFMYSQNYMSYNLTKWALILGVSFGVIMP
jgi:ABC-type antimicrobial peptide transport system permease subunit